jgi:S1-C subfamily serine protease
VGTATAGALAGCTEVPGVDESPPWEADFSAETKATAREVGREVQRAVVQLHVDAGISRKGTGWHLGDGEIVTNAHVLPTSESATVEVTWLTEEDTRSSERVDATILGQNNFEADELDLGLLSSPLTDLPSLSYAEETDLAAGDPLITVGHPIGAPQWVILMGSFHQYGVEGLFEESPWPPRSQLVSFLPSREGNSGAPLVSLDGTVVGCHWGRGGTKETNVKDPSYVHTDFADHRGFNLSVHSTTFAEQFERWR